MLRYSDPPFVHCCAGGAWFRNYFATEMAKLARLRCAVETYADDEPFSPRLRYSDFHFQSSVYWREPKKVGDAYERSRPQDQVRGQKERAEGLLTSYGGGSCRRERLHMPRNGS
jgi:hypothetical protein